MRESGNGRQRDERECTTGWASLFYRKRLIALPITDNATINDLGWYKEEGKYEETRERKKQRGRVIH